MRSFKLLLIVMAFLVSCNKKVDVSYKIEDISVYETKAHKQKAKNEAEYISILYTNLFQEAISPSTLYQAQIVLYSIGDQNVAKEMLLSNYFNRTDFKIPTEQYMRSNIEGFVIETYKRFLLRTPSEAEKTYFIRYITNNKDVTVEMVYSAFAASDEYGYY